MNYFTNRELKLVTKVILHQLFSQGKDRFLSSEAGRSEVQGSATDSSGSSVGSSNRRSKNRVLTTVKQGQSDNNNCQANSKEKQKQVKSKDNLTSIAVDPIRKEDLNGEQQSELATKETRRQKRNRKRRLRRYFLFLS